MLRAIEFFAGSGLVRAGLQSQFDTVWANDNSAKKADTYIANHGAGEFQLGDIRTILGSEIPAADLAWASFPCQDLSLAGNMIGMDAGTRSGLFWEWIRVLWELREAGKLPPVLVAENVVGFVVAANGSHFKEAYDALRELGYRVGALIVNADLFLPQSRPRAFVVAVRDGINLNGLVDSAPRSPFHTDALIRASLMVDDPKWVWWSMPIPKTRRLSFSELCERQAEPDPVSKTRELCKMLSPLNKRKLDHARMTSQFLAGTGYRRTRPDADGNPVQRLEVRFDGVAGCLRTPDGGSSRQTVLLVEQGQIRSRLLTVRECARLMGAPDSFKLPGSYNDGYRAMGDGVAVPVAEWLSRYLLQPLAARATGSSETKSLHPNVDGVVVSQHPSEVAFGMDF